MSEHKLKTVPQIFTDSMTFRERWGIYQLLMTSEQKGRAERKKFNRLFDALKLDEIEERMRATEIDEKTGQLVKKPDPTPDDLKATSQVELTIENIEFLLDTFDKLPMTGMGARALGPLEERLDKLRKGE